MPKLYEDKYIIVDIDEYGWPSMARPGTQARPFWDNQEEFQESLENLLDAVREHNHDRNSG